MKRKIISLALASVMALGSAAGIVSAASGIKTNIPYINGFGDGSFRPKENVTRGQVAKMVATVLERDGKVSTFPDAKDHWASKYIGALQDTGFINGYPDGTFKPDGEITRAELATILAKVNGGPSTAPSTFPDTKGHPAEGFIQKNVELGVINGFEDGTFRPDEKASREQTVRIINRAMGRMKPDPKIVDLKNPFKDVESGWWSEKDILLASTNFSYTVDDNGQETIVNVDSSITSVDVATDNADAKVSVVTKGVSDGTKAKVVILDKDGKEVDAKDVDVTSNKAEVSFEGLEEGTYKAKVTVGSDTSEKEFTIKITGTIVQGVDTIEWPKSVDYQKLAAMGAPNYFDPGYNPEMMLKFKVNGKLTTAAEMKAKGYDVKIKTELPVLAEKTVISGDYDWKNVTSNDTGLIRLVELAAGTVEGFGGTETLALSPDGAKFKYEVELTKDGKTFTSELKEIEVIDSEVRAESMEVAAPKVVILGQTTKGEITKLVNKELKDVKTRILTDRANWIANKNGVVSNTITQNEADEFLRKTISVESANSGIVRVTKTGAAPAKVLSGTVPILPLTDLEIKGMSEFTVGGVSIGKTDIKIKVGSAEKVISIQVVESNDAASMKTDVNSVSLIRNSKNIPDLGDTKVGQPEQTVTLTVLGESGDPVDLDEGYVTTDQTSPGSKSFEFVDTTGLESSDVSGGNASGDSSDITKFKKADTVGVYEIRIKATEELNAGNGNMVIMAKMAGKTELVPILVKVSVKNTEVSKIKLELDKKSSLKTLGKPEIGKQNLGDILVNFVGYDSAGNKMGNINSVDGATNLLLATAGGNETHKLYLNGNILETVGSDLFKTAGGIPVGSFVINSDTGVVNSGGVPQTDIQALKSGKNVLELRKGSVVVDKLDFELEEVQPKVSKFAATSDLIGIFTVTPYATSIVQTGKINNNDDNSLTSVELDKNSAMFTISDVSYNVGQGKSLWQNEVITLANPRVGNNGELTYDITDLSGVSIGQTYVYGTMTVLSSLNDPAGVTNLTGTDGGIRQQAALGIVEGAVFGPTVVLGTQATPGQTGDFTLVLKDRNNKHIGSALINYNIQG